MILSLDTATEVCAVALSDGPELVAELRVHRGQQHARLLTVLVQQLLEDTDVRFDQLQAVACCAGPGSYTGLRIGASAAKGYCLALGIPLLGVPTLQAVAAPHAPLAAQLGATLLPMLDARRMEVYWAAYTAGLEEKTPAAALVVEADVHSHLPAGPLLYVGDGVAKCAHLLARPGDLLLPHATSSAAGLATAAWLHQQAGHTQDVHAFAPDYLKPVRITTPRKKTEGSE